MGILDELKKLTKPYNDEDYLEEDMQDPVRAAPQDNRSYASYAEPPRAQEQAQGARRPYVFSQPQQAQQQQAQQQQGYYDQAAYQQGYSQQGYQPSPRQQQYARQQPYATRSYQQQGQAQQQQAYRPQQGYAPQAKLLLVRPEKFEVAADIADRIAERNAIVLNLEETEKNTSRRILDFLSGVTYALGGKIKKVAGNTYVITPSGMDFLGDSLEEMESRESYF